MLEGGIGSCGKGGGERGWDHVGRGRGEGMGSCERGKGDEIMWEGGLGWDHAGGGKGIGSCGRGKGTGEHCERCLSARF